jgi:hypothetical protein
MEALNKIMEGGLKKVCYANMEDWDDRVPAVLWAYNTIMKKIHMYNPFQLVYGEVVLPT